MTPTALQPLPRNPEREALGALGGYDYQIWRSIESWLSLSDNETLFLEGAEDIDRVNSAETVTVQVKRTHDGVSLNSQNARDAIRNFWATTQRSPERIVKFVYLTTSHVAKERDGRFGELAGIDAWGKAAFDPSLAEAVRQQLLESLKDNSANASVRTFLATSSVQELQVQLLQRFTWLPGQPDVQVVEQSVLERIGDALVVAKQPRSAAHTVKNALLAYCLKKILEQDPVERRLDRTALWQQIERATTITLELPLSSAGGLLVAAAQLASLQANFANLALLQGVPPSPPKALLRRQELVDVVSRRVVQRSAVLLAGSVFKGKTTIAQVVALGSGLHATWTELSEKTPAATSEIFKLIALTIERPDGPPLLIFDDLDTSARARRVYGLNLRQLVHRAAVAGKALLFTAQGHSEALEQEVAASWGVEILVVPAMSQAEIALHCTDFGCATPELATAWSNIVAMQSGGHPALVHVRLVELRNEGWPAVSLAAFTTPSPGTQSAKQMARELLETSVSPAANQFALEAGEFMVAPTRTMLLNLAGLPPTLAGASAILTNLTGRWLEEFGNGRYRVTQVLRGEVGVTWTVEQHRAVHAKLFDAISASTPISPIDAGALVFHAFIALDAVRFFHGVGRILTVDDDVQMQVLRHCSWVLAIDFANNPAPTTFQAAMPSLRQLQFLVAAAEEPARLDEVARAWRREIGPREPGELRDVGRVMYDVTVLTKHVVLSMEIVLDAIASAVRTEEPAASILAQGLANLKAMPVQSGIAVPQSATVFQTFLSLRSGGVRTVHDLDDLLAFLVKPCNIALTQEFDQMLEWAYVRDVGAFVHTGWVQEANNDSPNWEPWLNAFDRALAVCVSHQLPLYGAQVARAKSIVLSEYVGDMDAGFAALDDATRMFGPSAVIEEQRINLIGQTGDHVQALAAWDATIVRFGPQAVSDPFAYRRAAISAGRLGQFDRASALFEEGVKQLAEGFEETRVGLLIDASYCALRAGQRRRCSALLTQAVLLLPQEAWAEGQKSWEAIIQVANATAQLFEKPLQLRPDGKPVEIAIGRASGPGVSVKDLTAGQALRIGLLETQVTYLEAHWPDASDVMFDRVSVLLRGGDLITRLNGSKSFILRELVRGTSPDFLDYVLGMSDVLAEIHAHRYPGSTETVSSEEMLPGMLALGLLLATDEPGKLLERWLADSRSLNRSSVVPVLERLQTGLSMTPSAAAEEAVQGKSRDVVVNFGAAVRVCRSDEVQARHLVVASVRFVTALRSGMTMFFAPSLHAPVARMLAERLNQQTRLPAQFAMPSVAVPTIVQTVRQVRAGEASLKEVLVVGCSVTGVNPGDSIKQL